jgi:hypothetical protein
VPGPGDRPATAAMQRAMAMTTATARQIRITHAAIRPDEPAAAPPATSGRR